MRWALEPVPPRAHDHEVTPLFPLAIIISGVTLALAEITVLDPHQTLGTIGLFVIVAGTVWLTIRSNAIRFWKDETEAARAHVKTLEDRLAESEQRYEEKRDEKHMIESELIAERKVRDMRPVLESLAVMQQHMIDRQDGQGAIIAVLEQVSSAQQQQQSILAQIASKLDAIVPQ